MSPLRNLPQYEFKINSCSEFRWCCLLVYVMTSNTVNSKVCFTVGNQNLIPSEQKPSEHPALTMPVSSGGDAAQPTDKPPSNYSYTTDWGYGWWEATPVPWPPLPLVNVTNAGVVLHPISASQKPAETGEAFLYTKPQTNVVLLYHHVLQEPLTNLTN